VTEDSASLSRERPVLGVETIGVAIVVRLGGELDLYNVDQVRAALETAISKRPGAVVVDLAQVEFIDSTALGALVEARSKIGNGALRLASPQLATRRTLKVSGLDRHLPVHDSVEAALAAIT
jgi:anti-sigma B factor antagonist